VRAIHIALLFSISPSILAIPDQHSDQVCNWQLAEKRKAFMEMTEEQKKEAKAKAAGSRAEAKQAAANKGSDLVVINLSCAAPDKVVVTLDYPALSAPA
jgi:hypothetical protein